MLLFMDGFDKYGGANTNTTSVAALMAGEWTTITNANIAAALSATGQSLASNGASALTCTKTLGSAIGRVIGGVRFNSNISGNAAGVQFLDAGSNQCGIGITASTGIISLRNGSYSSGTILGSGATAVSANTTHYLEWDITIGASAAYNVYLDGVSIISGTGNTRATANNTINGVSFAAGSVNVTSFDDFYLFDTSGSANNAPLLTSPRIETTLPISDSAVQFAVGASTLGPTVARSSNAYNVGANGFYVRPMTPARSCTLNAIVFMANATNGTVNLRPVVYADSAGAPGSLLSSGLTVTGITSGTPVNMPLTTPQSLTAGTQYWLGYMQDVSVSAAGITYDTSNQGRTAISTFASGAPGTAPATTGGQTTALLWGNITLASAANYYEVSQTMPPAANTSYVTDTTVGHEDLYNFPNLSQIPASLYAVAVKAYASRSDSGARTVSLRTSSGGTDGGGSLTGQTPGTSYAWIGSNFETDPNGSIPWTGANLNAALTGIKIDA